MGRDFNYTESKTIMMMMMMICNELTCT